MLYAVLAELVLVLHLLFIAFAVAGGLFALRWAWAPAFHLPAVLWGVALELFGLVCPLTPLENLLRRAAGASGYTGGFVEQYLTPVIYPGGLTPSVQLALAALLVAANLLVYSAVWARGLRKGRERP